MSLARQGCEPVPTELWTSAYRKKKKKTYNEKKLIHWTEEMAKVMLSEGALRKENESLKWENLALKRTIEDFEDQQKICRKRNEFRKMEVDMQKKIQAQVAKLRMSVGNLLVAKTPILETVVEI